MGHRLDNYQEFVLTFSSPWNLGSKTVEEWSQSFYVSGTIMHNDADAEAAGLDLAKAALALSGAATSLVGITYYPTGSLVSTVQKTYPPGTHKGDLSAYSTTGGPLQQLEVAAVAHCPIGKNTRGKEIYLRKYFHGVMGQTADPNSLETLVDSTALMGIFNTGAGPHKVVPASPTSGATGGPWTIEHHLFTHQLRKGKKRKKPASQTLFDEIAKTVGEAAALELLKKALAGVAAAG